MLESIAHSACLLALAIVSLAGYPATAMLLSVRPCCAARRTAAMGTARGGGRASDTSILRCFRGSSSSSSSSLETAQGSMTEEKGRGNRDLVGSSLFSAAKSKKLREQRAALRNYEAGVLRAERSHCMPWKTSIDPEYDRDHGDPEGGGLFFARFWERQMEVMKSELIGLRAVPVVSRDGRDMSYSESTKMRMHTLLFASDEYRRIRMTLMDFGRRFQAFTTVWYPHPHANLPIFGANLMQFGRRDHVSAVDFQPIHPREDDHDRSYEHLLAPVRDRYPRLHGTLNRNVYDGTEFFSGQTLLARHESSSSSSSGGGKSVRDDDVATIRCMVFDDLLPAFESYMKKHIELVQSTRPNPDQVDEVARRHSDFGHFFLERDPTRAVLSKEFGSEFADDFLYNVFFPLSGGGTGSNKRSTERTDVH